MMSRSLRKWCLSHCSLVKMSEGLSFPPMRRILTLLLNTASLEALSRIWICRMALLVLFLDHWTQAILLLKIGMGCERRDLERLKSLMMWDRRMTCLTHSSVA